MKIQQINWNLKNIKNDPKRMQERSIRGQDTEGASRKQIIKL